MTGLPFAISLTDVRKCSYTVGMTPQEARRMARWLYDNGRTNVVICERFPNGGCYVKCMTPGMQPRVYNTAEEVADDSKFWT